MSQILFIFLSETVEHIKNLGLHEGLCILELRVPTSRISCHEVMIKSPLCNYSLKGIFTWGEKLKNGLKIQWIF